MIVFWVWIGWFLFVVFGGVGLISFPLDIIFDYFFRPKPRSAREVAERKVMLRTKVEELMAYIDSLKVSLGDLEEDKGLFGNWKQKRSHKHKESKLKKEIYELEKEYEIFKTEQDLSSNPVFNIILLIIGCIGFIFSFCILIQIIFYKLLVFDDVAHSEFLNKIFVFFEFHLARFISSILFSLIVVYVLLTVIKGNVKFGLRFLFFMPIHPMERKRTYINSFLFNCFLLLLCTPATLHFIITLFESYMRLTSGALLFTTILQNMKFFGFFYKSKIFLIIYLVWAGLTLIYLLFKSKSDRINLEKMMEERKKM